MTRLNDKSRLNNLGRKAVFRITTLPWRYSPPAQRILLCDPTSEIQQGSLRWYLGDRAHATVERVDRLPKRIPKDTRIIVPSITLSQLAGYGLAARRVRVMGPRFYRRTEAWTGATFVWNDAYSQTDRKSIRKIGADRYQLMTRELGGSASACVLTTGPSVDELDDADFSTFAVRVACNSIVANPSLLAAFRPNVFAFGDAVFHYGPSAYARAFRRDLRAMLETYDPWVVTSEELFPILQREFGDNLTRRVIPVPLRYLDHRLTRRDTVPRHVRKGNVLTTFMLPAAVGLAAKITVAGCDGRSPEDEGFWSHSTKSQYDELYQSAIDSHPSFFDDVDYVAYYLNHCDNLAAMLRRWRESGIEFDTMTESYVPAVSSLPMHK